MATAYLDYRWQGKAKTKKALKELVKAGTEVTVYSESIFGDGSIPDGSHALVGPAPYTRNWYATVQVKDGVILKVS